MSLDTKKILLIDDDDELCNLLTIYLTKEHFTVTSYQDGKIGYEEALRGSYDVIILDVMLPSMDGFAILRDLQGKISTPVLMLTAKGDEVDRIVGLEMGADDYLAKPCSPRELAARLKAIIRRVEKSKKEESSGIIMVDDIHLDNHTREVRVKDNLLALTPSQFEILKILMESVGKVVSKEDLCLMALGRELTLYDRSLDMHISHLRNKLDSVSESKTSIKTVRGMGYILEKMQS